MALAKTLGRPRVKLVQRMACFIKCPHCTVLPARFLLMQMCDQFEAEALGTYLILQIACSHPLFSKHRRKWAAEKMQAGEKCVIAAQPGPCFAGKARHSIHQVP